MSQGFGLMIESLVALLLLLTIGYCALLNERLKRLRADEQGMKATIAELVTATEFAERAVSGLKATARECEDTFGDRLGAAEALCERLDRQVSAGQVVLTRLARVVVAARALDDVPAAAVSPDPQVVAAAARSFSDRLRARVGALAA